MWAAASLFRGSNSSHGDTASGAPMSLETDTVTNGPEQSAAAQRHAHTSTPLAPPSVRVVTYNILADQYASTDYAQQHLFAYCPKQCVTFCSLHMLGGR